MPRLTDNAESFVSRLDRGESLEDVAADLLYGVEIEFSDAGDLCEGDGETECPYDDEDAVDSLESDAEYALSCRLAGGQTCQSEQIAREILRNMDLADAINGCTEYSWQDVVDSELESMRESWEPEGGEPEFQDVDGWEHCEDGTCGIVREYKTDEPATLADVSQRVHRLFDAAGDCEVPRDGSCHVHVSIPGCHHQASGNSALHACILYELSQLVDEFPEQLWRRVAGGDDRYFLLHESCEQKFTAVHCHPQGTWEFRLFGGLSDPDDCNTCISIAGRAMLAGYARFRAGKYHLREISVFRARFAFRTAAKQKLESKDIEPEVVNAWAEGLAIGHDFQDQTLARRQVSRMVVASACSHGALLESPLDSPGHTCNCSGCQGARLENLTAGRIMPPLSDGRDRTVSEWEDVVTSLEADVAQYQALMGVTS